MNARARQHYSFSNPPDERKAPSLTTIPALPCFRTTLPHIGRRQRQQNVAQSRGARAGPIHGPWTSRRVLERYQGILRVLRRGGEARNADLRGYTLVNLVSILHLWVGRHRLGRRGDVLSYSVRTHARAGLSRFR